MAPVTACIITRGNLERAELQPILASFPEGLFREVLVWENTGALWRYESNGYVIRSWAEQIAEVPDLGVYGRYAAIAYTEAPLIFVQDDDALLPSESIREIVWECDSGSSAYGGLVCNMPQAFRYGFYEEHSLVGFGACFHRSLPQKAFDIFFHYLGATFPADMPHALAMASAFGFDSDPNFLRTCDVVFTALTPHRIIDVPYENLPWAEGPDRMYRQPEHLADRSKALELAVRAKDAA